MVSGGGDDDDVDDDNDDGDIDDVDDDDDDISERDGCRYKTHAPAHTESGVFKALPLS